MNKLFKIASCVAAVLLANISLAITPDTAETWNSGTAEGWKGLDVLYGNSLSPANPSNCLAISFGKQSQSFPEVKLIYADSVSSDGRFAGNYTSAGITYVHFKIYCIVKTPSKARLYICNETSGRKWYYPLTGLQVEQWTEFYVPLNFNAGWQLDSGGTEAEFSDDLTYVARIGLRFQRDGSVAAQTYMMDNFELGTSAYGQDSIADTDGDGMTDAEELIAGTDAHDARSTFQLALGRRDVSLPGVVLVWKSVSNRWYDIWCTINLINGFSLLESNVAATPPVNEYEDITATNGGPYFYKISVKESQ